MKKTDSPRVFLIAFLSVAAAIMAYIFARVWLIPVTHEEAATTSIMSRSTVAQLITFDYASISASNHVLNSIFIKTWTGIWGLSPLTLRFGNLLAGVFYLWCGYLLLSRFFQNNSLRIIGLVIWIANPYLLEFFGLARGYGMSAALESGAVVFGVLFLQAKHDDPLRLKNLKAAFIFAALAVWSNFSLLNFYVCFTLLMAFALFRNISPRWKSELKVLLVTSGVLALLIFKPLGRINKAGDAIYFGPEGSLGDAAKGFAECLFMGKRYFGDGTLEVVQWVLLGICIASFVSALWLLWQSRWKMTAHAWLLMLLPGVVIANLLITKIAGSSYLNTRTTIFFYPLLACSILGLLKMLPERNKFVFWGLGLVFPVLLTFNFLRNANFREAYEWRYDRDTYTILNFIEKTYAAESRTTPYSLRCHCLQHPSFKFYIDWMKSPRYTRIVAPDVQEVPCTVSGPVDKGVDFYYVPRAQLEYFQQGYEVVLELGDADDKRVLLRKKG